MWVVVSLATSLLVYRALLVERTTVDDLFIFLRYARNLAERAEFAFSPGDRVEGTSSLFWTFLLALATRAGWHGVGAAKALSVMAMAATPVVAALALRGTSRLWAMAIPALALALDADFASWGSSGMDTAAWALALTGAVALGVTGRKRVAAVLLGLLPWVRPEGPLLTVLGTVVLAIGVPRREAWRLVALAAAPCAVLLAFRGIYFHEALPNTFYAKMHAVDGRDYTGLGYLVSELGRRPLLFVFGALGVVGRRRALLPLALSAGLVVFVLVAGGDWMPNRRLLAPALPLLAIAGGLAMDALPTGARWRSAAVAAPLLLFVEGAVTTDRALDQRWRSIEWLDRRLASYRPAARPFVGSYPLDWMPTYLLHQVAPYVEAGGTVAHVDVGELPYVMGDVAFLDGFGLVDRAAGRLSYAPHDPTWRARAREEFFDRRPAAALVVLDKTTHQPIAHAQAEILLDPRFAAAYVETARVPSWGDNPCVTFVRRDLTPAPPDVAAARIATWLRSVPDVAPAF